MKRARVVSFLALAVLTLLLSGCGSGQNELSWEATERPLRSDLGDLAPTENENQRLFSDVVVDLDLVDERQYTIESEQLWVVLYQPNGRPDDPLSYFEFQEVVGRDDADMIPALSELAAAVDYQFDEEAATEWVTTNDEGFGFTVKPLTPDDYGIYLNADDKLNNTVSLLIYFPTGSTEEPPAPAEPRFNGRPIKR